MTQPLPLPITQATPMDSSPPDTASTPPTSATAAPATKRKTLRLPENALTVLLGTIVAMLLGLGFTQTNDRISQTNDRISRLEDKVDAVDAKFDARFDEVDERFDEIDLKLTALIAALNATAEVEAALDGRLLDPSAFPDGSP